MLTDATNSKFQVGQVWKYQARPADEGSTLTVVKVESFPKVGVIVHVALQGPRVRNSSAPSGITTHADHLPMAEVALQKSVTGLVAKHGSLPSYEEGYQEWRKAFDAGHGGVFTVSVADVVTLMEKALNDPARH